MSSTTQTTERIAQTSKQLTAEDLKKIKGATGGVTPNLIEIQDSSGNSLKVG